MNRAEIARFCEFSEGAAFADIFRAAPRDLGLDVVETDEYVAQFAPSIDILLFNRAYGFGLNGPANEQSIVKLVSRFRSSGSTGFGIQISPEAQPAELPEWLSRQGLQLRGYWTKLYRPRDPQIVIPTDLRVERIDKSLAPVFGEVACAGFGMPLARVPMISATVGRNQWMHYIAWDGSSPAAVAALFVHDKVGWLGIAATIPEYRRRGAQGALITRRMRDGAAAGCDWFVTETGKETPSSPNPSFHNTVRAGFMVAYDRPNYMLPP